MTFRANTVSPHHLIVFIVIFLNLCSATASGLCCLSCLLRTNQILFKPFWKPDLVEIFLDPILMVVVSLTEPPYEMWLEPNAHGEIFLIQLKFERLHEDRICRAGFPLTVCLRWPTGLISCFAVSPCPTTGDSATLSSWRYDGSLGFRRRARQGQKKPKRNKTCGRQPTVIRPCQ